MKYCETCKYYDKIKVNATDYFVFCKKFMDLTEEACSDYEETTP